MSFDPGTHDGTGRDEEIVSAAFAAYKDQAPALFTPPPVDDIVIAGPARLRRRRFINLTALVGACTVVTAGGFAVAQNLTHDPDPNGPGVPPTVMFESPTAEIEDGGGDHSAAPSGGSEQPGDDGPSEPDAIVAFEAWNSCPAGAFAVDLVDWTLADAGGWEIREIHTGDLDGGGPETVMALACDDQVAVAAFAGPADAMRQMGWVWQPDGSQQYVDLVAVENGAVTLRLGNATETWSARYQWDGSGFVEIIDEPTPSAESEAPAPPEPTEDEASENPTSDPDPES